MLSVTPTTLRNVLDDMGQDYDSQVIEWKDALAQVLAEQLKVHITGLCETTSNSIKQY